VSALAAAGAGPAGVLGAQQALGATGRPTGVPARSTLAACAVSVVAIVTALVFGASVRALLDDAPRYGWNADLAVSFSGGYEAVDPRGAGTVAEAPGVEAVTVAGYAAIELADHSVSAMGLMTQSGPAPVTLLTGALPDDPNEVALGSTTARRLGVSPGDEVAGPDGGALQVTGLVAMPAVGQLAADHPSLGEGAVLTLDGLARRSPSAYPTVVFLDLAGDPSSADRATATALVARAMTAGLPPEAATTYADLRPGEIIGLSPARATTSALAGVLGLAAVLALVVTLSSSVRRQSRIFATLRALGFDRRQVRAAVRWQTNVTMVVALVVGGPIGLVAGRMVWRAFAEYLGSVATPATPWASLALAAALLVVLANLAGEGPARRAGRTSVQSLRDD
jgi:putative ABC transport system permease protein